MEVARWRLADAAAEQSAAAECCAGCSGSSAEFEGAGSIPHERCKTRDGDRQKSREEACLEDNFTKEGSESARAACRGCVITLRCRVERLQAKNVAASGGSR
jgi:hypothetical protein